MKPMALIKKLCKAKNISQAEKPENGVCVNPGVMIYDVRPFMEKPRERKAKHVNKYISPDEKLRQTIELDYDGKRDRCNGYDIARYTHTTNTYEAMEEAEDRIAIDNLSFDEVKQNTSRMCKPVVLKPMPTVLPPPSWIAS